METLRRLTRRRWTRLVFLVILAVITFFIRDVRGLRFQMVGVGSKGTLSPMTILLPVNGVLLGPFYGTLATFLGIMPHLILAPEKGIFGPYSILLPVTATFVAGLLSKGRWREAVAVFGGLIGAWYLLPTAREVWMLPYLHIATFVAIILLREKLQTLMAYLHWRMTIGLFLVALASVLTDHLVGNIIAVWDPLGFLGWNIPASAFYDVILLYAVERLSIALAATLVSTVFMYLLLTAYAPLPTILPTEETSLLPFSLPIGSVILVTGAPHSGKSELCKSLSYEKLRLGKSVSYMNVRTSRDDIRHRMGQLGIDVRPYEVKGDFRFVDAYTWSMKKTATEKMYSDEFETTLVGREILAVVEGARPSLFVLDSISAMLMHEPPKNILGFLQHLILLLKREKITTFMIVEEGVHDEAFMTGLHYLVDGILELRVAEEMGKPTHYMKVARFHGLVHPVDWIRFEITPKGTVLVKRMLPLEVKISEREVSATLEELEKGEFFKSLLEQLEEEKE